MKRVVSAAAAVVVATELFPAARGYSRNSSGCEVLERELDGFMAEQDAKWRSGKVGKTLTYLPYGGIGDQASGFLGAMVLAMETGRFLRVPGESFWRNGLEPSFETGDGTSLAAEDARVLPGWLCDTARDRRMPLAQFLATRRFAPNASAAWTNFYCGDHQLEDMQKRGGVSEYFTATHERVRVGNIGHRLFDVWLQKLGLAKRGRLLGVDPSLRGALYPCVFGRVLRPTGRVLKAAELTAPPVRYSQGRRLAVVGIHVRAGRYLSRSAYETKNDDVFGCDAPRHEAGNFSDIWRAARLLEVQLANADPDDTSSHARWLLVTDSESLKHSASDRFGPDKLFATPFVPSHPNADIERCARASTTTSTTRTRLFQALGRLTPEEEVVAELVLLSRVDALLVGTSRFSSLAVFWCASCRSVWFYTECTRPGCQPIHAADTEDQVLGASVVYATGLHADGHQILVGQHAIIEKLRPTDDSIYPVFF